MKGSLSIILLFYSVLSCSTLLPLLVSSASWGRPWTRAFYITGTEKLSLHLFPLTLQWRVACWEPNASLGNTTLKKPCCSSPSALDSRSLCTWRSRASPQRSWNASASSRRMGPLHSPQTRPHREPLPPTPPQGTFPACTRFHWWASAHSWRLCTPESERRVTSPTSVHAVPSPPRPTSYPLSSKAPRRQWCFHHRAKKRSLCPIQLHIKQRTSGSKYVRYFRLSSSPMIQNQTKPTMKMNFLLSSLGVGRRKKKATAIPKPFMNSKHDGTLLPPSGGALAQKGSRTGGGQLQAHSASQQTSDGEMVPQSLLLTTLATQPRALPQLCSSEQPFSSRGLTVQSNVWWKTQEQSKVPVTILWWWRGSLQISCWQSTVKTRQPIMRYSLFNIKWKVVLTRFSLKVLNLHKTVCCLEGRNSTVWIKLQKIHKLFCLNSIKSVSLRISSFSPYKGLTNEKLFTI